MLAVNVEDKEDLQTQLDMLDGVCGYGLVCDVMWCGVVWCGVVWCGVVWCGVVWCGVVWCGVVWCGVVWCVFMCVELQYDVSQCTCCGAL